ncbi:hypothetical protein THAOC_16798 [Thalassiosira oceanica]|uniref:Uncharacterized protein n=1 Tax=Thalassiosira oceanica TaxID=159749 RepID=K0S8U3_THAOC|nr:hypothetical protein THAOC_16798 [Thalassiosira oceanica]|eukprot:EJK62578.1 hypothetical protein THAOC_16798 [Thalassiosira oceanica]
MKFLPTFLPPFVRSEVTSDTNKLSCCFHFGHFGHARKGSPLSQLNADVSRDERGEYGRLSRRGRRLAETSRRTPRHRRRILAGQHLHEFVHKPGAEPPTARGLVVSPVHRSRDSAMPTIKLTDAEVEGRRRLLLEFIDRLRTEEEARQYIAAVRLLVDVSDALEAQALGAFHDAREAEVAETRRTDDDARVADDTGRPQQSCRPKVVNPYAKRPKPTGYEKIIQKAQPKPTSGLSKKKSGAGRPQGTTNKEGHRAGGDRKSERFKLSNQPRDRNQPTLNVLVRRSAPDGDDGDDDSSTSSSSSDNSGGGGNRSPSDNKENRRKSREKQDEIQAIQALKKYAASFPNGTIEEDILDDDDDDDEDDDFDNDDGGVNEDGDERSKSRRKCYPVVGSPVHRYLDGIHTRVQRHLNRGSNSELQGHHNSINISDTFWIAPKGNPVGDSFGTTAKPDSFYTARVFVFLWDPMLQFPNHVPSKVTCPKCGSTNTKCDGGWNFRPFHWFDRIIYIYHRFVACNGCGARCPTVRADFISKLPTLVAEQFPFTLPSERGPGLYDPMISMMKLFFTEGIMWGKFAKVINSLQSSNFARNHVSYLDSLDHWLTVQPSLFVESRVPLPFSPQTSQEGYCGIKLRPSLLKSAFRARMVAEERYIQASFQLANDEGISTDDSHKLTGYIHATVPGGRKVQPYTCTSTAISLAGRVCYSRFTPNKAINVLSNVIEAYGLVRKHVGQEMLLRMEVDNGAHDVVAHISSSPSLLNDV